MCIIAAKPAGVPMPDNTILRNMWDVNSDGAGFMYVENGNVRIEKGFMKYKHFIKALEKVRNRLDLTATPVVMHFRITTHGGTKPENTHPFPITDNVTLLGKPKSTTDVGVAHNGVIYITPRKGISDTMEYVASQLAPLKKALPRFYTNKWAMQMIENAIDSKMAFLTRDGKIYTIGDFVESDGILYSNHSFESWYTTYRNKNWYSYTCGMEDEYPDAWGNTYGYGTSGICAAPFDTGTKNATVAVPTFKRLMPLDEGEYYVLDEMGQMWAGYDEYFLAENGDVYYYDYEADEAFRVDDYEAFTVNGAAARYDDDKAENLRVVPA